VVAKYLEKLGPDVLSGKRCLDLSAGCGLVGESKGCQVVPPGDQCMQNVVLLLQILHSSRMPHALSRYGCAPVGHGMHAACVHC
jgi:hypothetical protein